ncbi:hypothetical protein ACVXG7_03445 [Enterobacter hormaechei]
MTPDGGNIRRPTMQTCSSPSCGGFHRRRRADGVLLHRTRHPYRCAVGDVPASVGAAMKLAAVQAIVPDLAKQARAGFRRGA